MKIDYYEAYVETEISWLQRIPQHWNISRIKCLTQTKSGTTPKSGSEEYYENGKYFWVRTADLNDGKLYSSEFKVTDLALKHYNLIFIQPGSILLAMYGGMGTIGKNSLLGIEATINQSVCSIFPNPKRFDSQYLWYYIKFFKPNWERFADSARKDPNINQEAIKRLWVLLPPLSEQKSIAHYLDTKTAQIDRKIDLLTQKAKRYEELKRSLINETVIGKRRIDNGELIIDNGKREAKNSQLSIKNYPLYKDSAIEWIGEVPEHWQLKRLKDIGTSIIGITYAPEDALGDKTSGLLVLRSSNIQNGQLSLSDTVYVNKKVNPRQIVKKGDILICSRNGSRALIGKNICIDEKTEGQTFGAFMTVYRSKYFRFISKFFNSNVFESQSGLFGSSTINQLTVNTLNNFLVILPPLSEQKTIAHYLATKTAHIDLIIQTINTQIEKLKELRKTLINDVVTGKIKIIDNGE